MVRYLGLEVLLRLGWIVRKQAAICPIMKSYTEELLHTCNRPATTDYSAHTIDPIDAYCLNSMQNNAMEEQELFKI